MTDTVEREMLERLRGDLGTGAETGQRGFLSPHVMSLLAIAWLAVAGILALIGTWVAITPPKPVMLDVGQIDIWFNAALLSVAVTISVVIGLVNPIHWRRVMAVITVLPVPVVLFTS